MHRGELKLRLNLINDDPVDIACFVPIARPQDPDEVETKITEALIKFAKPYHNSLLEVEADTNFYGDMKYQMYFGSDCLSSSFCKS